MKKNLKVIAIAGLTALSSGLFDNAHARNATIENALERRPELSAFYQGLINTGVIDELDEDTLYTVFAPTNAAVEKMTRDQYPCFYSDQCVNEVADILRNHIVAGKEVNFNNPGQNAVFSVNKKELKIGQSTKNQYTIDGHNVVAQNQLAGGIVDEIDGVIATPQQLVNVSRMKYPFAQNENGVERRTVTERVFYAPDGEPDGVSRTTTVTRTSSR